MKQIEFGVTGRRLSSIVLGLMRIPSLDAKGIRALYDTAREAGIDVFDHADIYGRERHECEKLFSDAVRLSASERAEIFVQSKVGIRKGFFDFSKEHILATVDESLAALRTDYLDLLLLHRPDALVEPEEVAEAFDQLEASGKVRHFGVSNHVPGQIELLKTAVRQPLQANQIQLSIAHAPTIASGLAANMANHAQSVDRDNGMIDHARLNKMTLQAWSPFQKDFFGGVFLEDREGFGNLNAQIDRIAADHGVPRDAVPVAWIARHPANIQTVLGTTNAARVKSASKGADVRLSREEWYGLLRAAGYTLP
jgi:predicted oxidoreductase